MTILRFCLDPVALNKLHDALVCLGRFHESVCLEATRDHLVLSSLNSSKTGYAAFTFDNDKFFTKYVCSPPRIVGSVKEKFTCRIYNKALLSVFKARPSDPSREKDIGIDKCEVSIEDGGEVKSRLIVQMTCRHGVLKTYHLTFEGASSMHAVFKSETMRNVWSMSSHRLAANAGHFGPKTEQLDIYSENGKAVFTSYTEKVVAGKEVLKQPLTTSISVSTGDFSNFRVEDQLHIIISVKDFKNIVSHAAIMDTEVTASYSHPSKPMQIKYGDEAMHSEFILMTLGEYRGASATPQPAANVNARANSARTQQQPQMQQLSAHGSMRAPQAIIGSLPQSNYSGMAPPQMSMCPPPPRSATANSMRQTPSMSPRRPETPGSRLPPTQASYVARPLFEEEESLFVSQDDEDRMFDPAPDDEDAEMLGWDATAVYEDNPRTISQGSADTGRQPSKERSRGPEARRRSSGSGSRYAPTQRMSQVRGMFDED